MKRFVLDTLAVVTGVAVALLAATVILLSIVPGMTITHPNGWITARDLGSADTDPLTKAFIARIGLLANSKEEALYLNSFEGEPFSLAALRAGGAAMPLEGGVAYEVKGRNEIPASWWSITLYGADHYLYPNSVSRYSVGASTVQRDDDGNWSLYVAPECETDCQNWLPSPGEGTFSLTLRIYGPEESLYRGLSEFALPAIHRLGRQ